MPVKTPFRVLISDSMSSRAEEILQACAVVDCDSRPGLSAEELLGCIGEYHGLLVRSRTVVTEEVMTRASNLRLVGRAGVGVDNIDVAAATKRGVYVENAPNGNAITTAEHAICLLLSLSRHIPPATASMKANLWEKKRLQGTELYRKTLGLIGLGNIGKLVAERGLGLQMKVIACDPVMSAEQAAALGVELVRLDALLERSHFISVHTPLNVATRGLLGTAEFAKMRPGALLVNAARGGIVDEEACVAALNSGHLGGAAFDVFCTEPPPADHPLVAHPKVICTPHLGASTADAQIKVAVEIAEQMVAFAESGALQNVLNPEAGAVV